MTDHLPLPSAVRDAETLPAETAVEGPFLSVVVRTQGRRPRMLAETLASLSLQTSQDFEVCVVRHRVADTLADEEHAAAVADIVARAPSTIGPRCRLLTAPGGSRGVPLNVGIAAAKGRYLAFLDDDDLARPDWVATFKRAAEHVPGALIRARALSQPVRADPLSGYEVVGGAVLRYRDPFDLIDHLHENRTPICVVAWPIGLFQRPDIPGGQPLRVDETLAALEDWDLLLQAVARCVVNDVDVATSIYRSWVDDSGSRGQEGESAWTAARAAVSRRVGDRDWHLSGAEAAHIQAAADELAHFRRFANELASEVGVDLTRPAAAANGEPVPITLIKSEFGRLHRELATSLQRAAQLDGELARTRAELALLKSSPGALLDAARRSMLTRLGLRNRPARSTGAAR